MPQQERPPDDAMAELAARAAARVGKDAATRAADKLLGGAEGAGAPKARRSRLLAGALLALCLLLGLIGLVLHYWAWFLGAGVLGLGGLFGYWRLKSRLAARRDAKRPEKIDGQRAPAEPVEPAPQVPARVRLGPAGEEVAAARREEAELRARALAEARASSEQAVEDELAAMKARLRR